VATTFSGFEFPGGTGVVAGVVGLAACKLATAHWFAWEFGSACQHRRSRRALYSRRHGLRPPRQRSVAGFSPIRGVRRLATVSCFGSRRCMVV